MTSPTDHDPSVPRVLVVDDEEAIRTFVERVLRTDGYEVAVASNGVDALRVVEEQGQYDLYVLDVAMPEMSGDELARRLHRLDPDVRVLYLTGFSDRLFAAKPSLWEHEAFVDKPVTINGLLEAVALLLYGHTRRSN